MGPVLITGAAGFLGSNLAAHLARRGRATWLVARAAPGEGPEEGPAAERVLVGPAGPISLELGPELARCDAVVHLASATNPRRGGLEDELDQLRELGQVLAAAAACGRPPRVVWCSSGGTVYGEGDRPHGEDDPTRPASAHAWGKVAGEALIAAERARTGVPASVLRCANVYGPRQVVRRQGLVMALLEDLRAGRATELWGDGEEVRDYVYVDDVCELVARVVGLEPADRRADLLNVGSGAGTTVREVVAAVTTVTGRAPRLRWAPAPPGLIRRNVLEVERAAALGWRATTPLREGIARTWAWLEGRCASPT